MEGSVLGSGYFRQRYYSTHFRLCQKLLLGGAMPTQFGRKLAHLRAQRRLTQIELAALLGIESQGYISDLEAGSRIPSLDLATRAATAFQTTLDYLLRDAVPVEAIAAAPPHKSLELPMLQGFGAKLRRLREQRGLSQSRLARESPGITQGAISNLEAGRKIPSLGLVVWLANYFAESIDFLVFDEG